MKESNPISPPLGYEQQPRRGLATDADLTNEIQLRLENWIMELETMISQVPWVSTSIKKHHLQSFVDSPFADEICMIKMPSRFTYPTMKMYNGDGDPDDHIAQYK